MLYLILAVYCTTSDTDNDTMCVPLIIIEFPVNDSDPLWDFKYSVSYVVYKSVSTVLEYFSF